MPDRNDALRDGLWKLYLDHYTYVRHHDTQRSTVAGAFVAISAALLGLITFDRGITVTDLPAAIFLIVLALFGALFSAKQWERSAFHAQRAREYRNRLDELLGGTAIRDLKAQADAAHAKEFPVLSRLRIHAFWIGLYLLVAAIGAGLVSIALWAPIRPHS
ncbi:MAG TPA: hypothetical protein VF771_04830 [Longimicrobiaceae bacterium]